MNGRTKALVGLAAAALLLLTITPVAEAQCPTGAREFATVGGGSSTDKLRIIPNGAHNSGLEIGRFWDSNNSGLGNNFEGNCPSQGNGQIGGGWWQLSQSPNRGIRGFVSGTGCSANTCPEQELTVVIEDWGPSGPPGVNDTGYFIVFRVDRTAGAIRDWDFARTDNPVTGSTLLFHEFPAPIITGSAPAGLGNVNTTQSYVDVDVNFHGVNNPGVDIPLSVGSTIVSYDLMRFTGSSDPGRSRASWSLATSVPYQSGGIVGFDHIAVCDTPAADTFLALGMTFFGGGLGLDVPSALVGRAIQVECDPNLADPAPVIRPGLRRGDRTGRTPAARRGR